MREVEETDQIETPVASRRGVALFGLDNNDEHYPGALLRTEPGLYLVRIAVPIELGTRLVMVDGPYRFEIEVLSCDPIADNGWRVGCKVLACREGTIRQEWRMPVNQPARLQSLSSGKAYDCRIRDQSPFGMGVELNEALAAGLQVSLTNADGFAYGEVRYCRPRPDGGYFAGILLREYAQTEHKFKYRLTRFLVQTLVQLFALAGFRRKL